MPVAQPPGAVLKRAQHLFCSSQAADLSVLKPELAQAWCSVDAGNQTSVQLSQTSDKLAAGGVHRT